MKRYLPINYPPNLGGKVHPHYFLIGILAPRDFMDTLKAKVMNKTQLQAALTAAGIQFDANADKAALQAIYDANNLGSTTIKEQAPRTTKALVEITDTSEIEAKGIVVINGVHANGDEWSGTVGLSLWETLKGAEWCKEGTVVQFTGESRIAGKTTYTDQSGEVKHHTSDGFSINRMNKGSKSVFNRRVQDFADTRSAEAKLTLQAQYIDALSQAKEAGIDQMALAALLGSK